MAKLLNERESRDTKKRKFLKTWEFPQIICRMGDFSVVKKRRSSHILRFRDGF
uniref:Uncharacterized protein n=1 Tax=Leptospira santarosai serovar Arenal str. MAVJ 401 TaxID=1049976 RepID=M6JR04_9LEPT|nr:hypothetical protein LEP1GSC063_0573 [Leptospira santarosai serovar Arenal str. MAVJ 401]